MDVPNYVMVPVPEHLVPEVMRQVLVLLSKEVMQAWDQESLDEVYGEMDETSKTIVSIAARAKTRGEPTTADEIASSAGLAVGQVMNLIRAVNAAADEGNRPVIVQINVTDEELANGRTVRRRYVEVNDKVAEMILVAESAERAALPHHLQGDE